MFDIVMKLSSVTRICPVISSWLIVLMSVCLVENLSPCSRLVSPFCRYVASMMWEIVVLFKVLR